MKTKALIIVLIASPLMLVYMACSSTLPPIEENIYGESSQQSSTTTPTMFPDVYSGVDTEQMIVRTANMYIAVEDIDASLDNISLLAESLGGYVVSSNSWREGTRNHGTIVIRVLVDNYNDALNAISELAVEVNSKSMTSVDVSEEYADLDAKLKNLEAAESQLLLLMEKAETVEDILSIQKELTNTREDIELIKGRMQYLERTSETSLIEIHLDEAGLQVELTADSRSVSQGKEISFWARVSGGFEPYSYEWDFGDGDTSTSSNPRHAYKSQGEYTVSVTVTDDRGNKDTKVRSDYITVLPSWDIAKVVETAWNGLVVFGKGLVNVIIWIGIFSPLWIVAGVLFYFLRRRRKRTSQ